MEKTVLELAQLIGGKVVGNESLVITETRGFEQAAPQSITFAIGEYVEHIGLCKAGVVILEQEAPNAPMTQIIVDNAKVAFAQVLQLFHPPVVIPREIHPTAIIGENVKLGDNIAIGAYCVINDNAVIGDNVTIRPYVYIGHNTRVGNDCDIYTGAVVHENCILGNRVVLRAKAVIGGEGFGFATENGVHTHIPQVGNVILEDDVEIGSCTTIDNATMGSTLVRKGTKIDNLVHLGHNVEIGENCFLIAQVGIAGSTKCGNNVIFAGQTGCTGHITIGDNAKFAGKTGITGNVPADAVMAGYPMRPHKEWLKLSAYEHRLPEMVKTVKQLQKEIDALKAQLKES